MLCVFPFALQQVAFFFSQAKSVGLFGTTSDIFNGCHVAPVQHTAKTRDLFIFYFFFFYTVTLFYIVNHGCVGTCRFFFGFFFGWLVGYFILVLLER